MRRLDRIRVNMNNQRIIQVIEREIREHRYEIKRHSEIYSKTKSRRQKEKIVKHHHKLFQTKLIAKALGLKICECCGKISG